MSSYYVVDKTHVPYRSNYVNFPLRCPICIKTKKNSKTFKSPYALLYHLTNVHDSQDEILANLTTDAVRAIIPSIAKAIQWHILF